MNNCNIYVICHAILIFKCDLPESCSGKKAKMVNVAMAEVEDKRQACFTMQLPDGQEFFLPVTFIKNRTDCFIVVGA